MTTNHIVDRLKNVLVYDTNTCLETLKKLIKSDVFSLLSEYMILDPDSICINFEQTDGIITLKLTANPTQLISAGYTIEN